MTKLIKGNWYHITWIDAVSDETGNPHNRRACIRQNIWRFLGNSMLEWRNVKHLIYDFQYGLDETDQTNAGWICIPSGMLIKAEKVNKPKNEFTAQELERD